jgi:SAM-dependent methyltransferase
MGRGRQGGGRDGQGRREGNRSDRGPRGPGRRDREPGARPVDDFWSRLIRDDGSHEFLEKTPCPACGTLPARIQGRLGPTLLRRCKHCGLRYVSPRLATALREEIMRREPDPISSERNLQLRHRAAERMERMHREMPPLRGIGQRSATLLEIGCRWGHFLQLCRPHYAAVEGLEWSKERAAFARERFDLQVSATDIFRDPWETRYDIACAWGVIQREPHPLEFLRWVHAHLNPGGLVVLSTANYDSLVRRIVRKRWYGFEPARQLCYFTPPVLQALLEKAGFTEVKIRTSGLAPLRDWFLPRNRVDRGQDARSQWLESLREREALARSRKEKLIGVTRESGWSKFKTKVAEAISGILTAPGWGDQMRVYARKP